MPPFTALVLAGRRGGADDPLAPVLGDAPHRALLDVAGTPMLVRVVRALRGSSRIGRIFVSIDRPEVLESAGELAALIADGSLVPWRATHSPSRSVGEVLEGPAGGEPVLVTTADHALLRTEWVDHFADAADASGRDVLVGLVERSVIRARFPESRRTYLRLGRARYSGANLFAFRTASARRAAAFWVRAEQFRKRPWRLVAVFGPVALLRYALGRIDLESALAIVSRAMGTRLGAVELPFAEAAIDVDRPADLELAMRILAERGSEAQRSESGPSSAPKRPLFGS